MPGQLLRLRLLGSPSKLLVSPGGVSVLKRAFPFKLKYYSGISPSQTTLSSCGFRAFSSMRRGNAGAKGKSLMEDEAELSDWLSDLKTDSLAINDGDDGRRERVRSGGRDEWNGEGRDRARASARGSGRDRVRSNGRDEWNGGGRDGIRANDGGNVRDRVRSNVRGGIREGREMGRSPPPSLRRNSGVAPARGRDSEFQRRPPRGRESGPARKMMVSDEDDEDDDDDDEKMHFGSGRGRGIRSSASIPKRGRIDSSFKISDDDDGDDDDVDVDDDGVLGEEEEKGKLIYSEYREKSTTQSSGSQCDDSYLTDSRFDQCSISPLSLKGVKAAGYERMTVVQAATLPEILKGKDVLAKAKTGTGKTVAFLLPSIEVVINSGPVDRDQRRQPISVLVVCPTRELANQAAMEAGKLLKFHASIGVQVVTGGTRLALEQKRMQANPCQILVATPGRLRDHIENTPGFATRLMGVKVLVLDEADHLLDMGFRNDIERIVAAVPKQRQTLLFSATVPDEVRQICYIALKRDHEFINTVEEGEETHSQVSQLLLVAPLDKQFPTIYGLLTDHISDNVDYKVLVFCTTAMVTKLMAGVLSELNLNVREMHSRKPQSYRTRVSDEFRKSKGIILVTSDVSARGVDYPDVTLVIQVGVPSDREQYIHRLGRTGRKGKQGQGILLLAPWEEFFVSIIKDLPVSKASPPLIDPETRKKVERALAHVEMKNKEAAYQAWLGYYNSNKAIGRDKARLVGLANEFSRSMGLDSPPALSKIVLGKMGLRNVPGLRSK